MEDAWAYALLFHESVTNEQLACVSQLIHQHPSLESKVLSSKKGRTEKGDSHEDRESASIILVKLRSHVGQSQTVNETGSEADIHSEIYTLLTYEIVYDSSAKNEQLSSLLPTMKSQSNKDSHSIIPLLISEEKIEELIALPIRNQSSSMRWRFWREVFGFPVQSDCSLTCLRSNLGDEVAYYYVFMSQYCTFLSLASLLSLVFFLTCYFSNGGTISSISGMASFTAIDIDDNPFAPIFGFSMVVWSHLFLKYWTRQARHSSVKFGSHPSFQDTLHRYDTTESIRTQFKGTLKTSPVTGKPELFDDRSMMQRVGVYILGSLLTLLFLAVVFGFMICSLNMQGYVKYDESQVSSDIGECNSDECLAEAVLSGDNILQAFHIEFFEKLSRKGELFDVNELIPGLIPVIIHTAVVFAMNQIYSRIALWLTDLENHKYQSSFDTSLICKRFVFEFIDAFLPLFFLAFVAMDLSLVRTELVSLFAADEIRRISIETLLPALLNWWNAHPLPESKKVDGNITRKMTDEVIHKVVEYEQELDEYENFDDYLEMVLQFGYLTLFACAFPLASVVALIENCFEIWSDSIRLCFLTRRVNSLKSSRMTDINGAWLNILCFISWMSILTNTFLFSLSSDQMQQWFPDWFKPDAVVGGNEEEYSEHGLHGLTSVKQGKGRYVLIVTFFIEHVLFMVATLIHWLIPDQSTDTGNQIKRIEYERAMKEQSMRISKLKKA